MIGPCWCLYLCQPHPGPHISFRRFFVQLARYSPGICVTCGEVWKGDIMIADIEELEEMDASENPCWETQCRRSVNADERRQFYFPGRRSKSQNLWRRSTSETIHLNPGSYRNEERNKKFFKENQTGSLLPTLFKMTLHWMMRKLKMISGLSREISFTVITLYPQSNCSCRKKNHFLFR